jgi:hypothetical protein
MKTDKTYRGAEQIGEKERERSNVGGERKRCGLILTIGENT